VVVVTLSRLHRVGQRPAGSGHSLGACDPVPGAV